MLEQLFPKAHRRYLSLLLLGPILDGYDDWLAIKQYTRRTRRQYLRMSIRVDGYLRERGRKQITDLSVDDLQDLWTQYHLNVPCARSLGGTIRTITSFLSEKGLLKPAGPAQPTPFDPYLQPYEAYLRDIRGFTPSTIHHHLLTATQLLIHLLGKVPGVILAELNAARIESFLTHLAKDRGRGTMQHEVAHVRSFLRFLAITGAVPAGLDEQIDTPRAYRPRPPVRALAWETVETLLQRIDRTSFMGLRDYTMFLLMTHYGLRPSEIVDLTVDDIAWRQREIRIIQRKTGYPLYLPLTDQVGTALIEYLRKRPRNLDYRQLFLRVRAPVGALKPTAVTEAFQHWVSVSALPIPFQGPYCLRHSYAVHLLRLGVSIKIIGDLLGHRMTESTATYLRLSLKDLREVALPLPQEVTHE